MAQESGVEGPNLAKGNFLANGSLPAASALNKLSFSVADSKNPHGGNYKVRTMHKRGGIKAKCVVKWTKRTFGTRFTPIERSLSIYLAKFWGFARLGPSARGSRVLPLNQMDVDISTG
jgi:hypothetical protein